MQRKLIADKNATHGHTRGGLSPLYQVWKHMYARCYYPNNKGFHNYGGRGITVCERWHEFANFLADMGERPTDAHEIDRINNNGSYEPGNCRWATRQENSRNRRTNHSVTHDGKTMCIAEWSEVTGLRYSIIHKRLANGWSPEKALTTPVQEQYRHAS